MAFVKLDCGILDSTLWVDRESREVFITALLMAEPIELKEPTEQISVRSLDKTGWVVPAGWYGFVPASGVGIVRRAMVERESGLLALEKLGGIDDESRSKEHGGRRLIRVDGGYLVLNYFRYRERDYTAAERARRYREKRAAESKSRRDVTPSRRDVTPSRRDITHAEAEAEAELRPEDPLRVSSGGARKEIAKPVIDVSVTGEVVPRGELSIEFSRWVQLKYPACQGQRQWSAALHNISVILAAGRATEADLRRRVAGYRAFVDTGGVSGPEYVRTPQKFFELYGEDLPWQREWEAVKTKAEQQQDANIAAGQEFLSRSAQ